MKMKICLSLSILFLISTMLCNINDDLELINKMEEISNILFDSDIFCDTDGKRKTFSESEEEIVTINSVLSDINNIAVPDSSLYLVQQTKDEIIESCYLFLIKAFFSIGDTRNTILSYTRYKEYKEEKTLFMYRYVVSRYIMKEISIDDLIDSFNEYESAKGNLHHNSFIIFSLLLEKDLDSIEYYLSQITEDSKYPNMITLLESHVFILKKEYVRAIDHWKVLDESLDESPWLPYDDLFILEEEYLIEELESEHNEFLACLLLKHVDEFDRSVEYFDKYLDKFKLTTKNEFRDFVSAKYDDEVVNELLEYYKEVKNK